MKGWTKADGGKKPFKMGYYMLGGIQSRECSLVSSCVHFLSLCKGCLRLCGSTAEGMKGIERDSCQGSSTGASVHCYSGNVFNTCFSAAMTDSKMEDSNARLRLKNSVQRFTGKSRDRYTKISQRAKRVRATRRTTLGLDTKTNWQTLNAR